MNKLTVTVIAILSCLTGHTQTIKHASGYLLVFKEQARQQKSVDVECHQQTHIFFTEKLDAHHLLSLNNIAYNASSDLVHIIHYSRADDSIKAKLNQLSQDTIPLYWQYSLFLQKWEKEYVPFEFAHSKNQRLLVFRADFDYLDGGLKNEQLTALKDHRLRTYYTFFSRKDTFELLLSALFPMYYGLDFPDCGDHQDPAYKALFLRQKQLKRNERK